MRPDIAGAARYQYLLRCGQLGLFPSLHRPLIMIIADHDELGLILFQNNESGRIFLCRGDQFLQYPFGQHEKKLSFKAPFTLAAHGAESANVLQTTTMLQVRPRRMPTQDFLSGPSKEKHTYPCLPRRPG